MVMVIMVKIICDVDRPASVVPLILLPHLRGIRMLVTNTNNPSIHIHTIHTHIHNTNTRVQPHRQNFNCDDFLSTLCKLRRLCAVSSSSTIAVVTVNLFYID